MKEEEKQIWNAHQKRLTELSREKTASVKDYIEKRRALQASYGNETTPQREITKLDDEVKKRLAKIKEDEDKEINRVMGEFEDYDQSRNAIPIEKQTSDKKDIAIQGNESKPKSRFLNSLHYTRLKEKDKHEKEKNKDKSADKDDR